MKKSKIFLIISIVLLSLVFLTGCRRTDENPQPNNDQVVLIWWNMFDSQENVQPLIDAFQSSHPNVVIQYQQQGIQGGVDAYRNLLDNAISDNDPLTTPDIFTVENTWVGKYTPAMAPAPTDIVTPDTIADFYPIVQSEFASNNQVLGLPMYMDTLALIYNKDKLIEAGYTVPDNQWSEFQNQAFDLTKRDTSNQITQGGFAAADGENVQFNFDILSLLMLQNGVDLSNTAGLDLENDDFAQDSFDFYEAFSDSDGSWDSSMKLDVASFLEERLAVFAAPSWRLNDILIYNQQYNLGIDVGVAPMPQLGGTDTVHWGTYWGQSVAKDSPNQRVAWEFVEFITQAEQLRTLDNTVKENGRVVGVLYPRLSMAEEIVEDEYLGIYVQSAPFAKTWPMKDGYLMEDAFNNYFTEDIDLVTLNGTANNILKN